MMQETKKPSVDMAMRDKLRETFLQQHDLQDEKILPLPSDASFRRYFRLPNKNMLVMDSPPDLYPTIIFDKVAGLLNELPSARVAKIFARDHDNGFLLLEDLGKDSLTNLLNANLNCEEELYSKAIAGLLATQMAWQKKHGDNILPPYDDKMLFAEARLLPEWYVPAENNITPDGKAIDEFFNLLHQIYFHLATHHAPPFNVFVHRDFHVDNLLLAGDDIAWLDFQDGVMGHPTYDVMSLLEDARRDITPATQKKLWQAAMNQWQQQYPDHKKLENDFCRWFYFLGVTRHAKVLGIFIRLEKRDGKKNYRQHLPRVLRLLQASMAGLVAISQQDKAEEKVEEKIDDKFAEGYNANADGNRPSPNGETGNGTGCESMAGAVKKLQHLLQEWQLL